MRSLRGCGGFAAVRAVVLLTGLAAPLHAAETDERPMPGMKARVFQLKHRDADDVVDALRPLVSDARGAMLRDSDELNTISARDFPENLAALAEAIKRLDLPTPPQPDVELTIRILLGSPDPGAGQVPGDLEAVVKQLGTTLSYKSYHLVASVTQRLRAGAGTSGKGELTLGPPASGDKGTGSFSYHIDNRLLPPPAAGAAPLIAIRRFKFTFESGGLGRAEVATGLTLRESEKVVVGTGSLKNRAMIVVVSGRRIPN